MNPQDYESFKSRGLVQAELKNYDAAIADLEKAIKLKEDFTDADVELGIISFNFQIKSFQFFNLI